MSGGVPAGWVLVPVEPTEAMRKAGEAEMMARHTNLDCFNDPYVDSTYAAMLAATPTPPIEGRDADVERVADEMFVIVGRVRRAECTYEEGHDAARAALQALGERG